MPHTGKNLSQKESETLLAILKNRFDKYNHRHTGIAWTEVQQKLEAQPGKLKVLNAMEISGGEPDVIGMDPERGEYLFCDCSAESPAGRRSFCYDREALNSRKENKPENSVLESAAEMGVSLLTEDQYRQLQQLGEFDLKTSSWIQTPPDIRKLGGALFCDRRYDTVFVYHNGASSYYAARGFRGVLKI